MTCAHCRKRPAIVGWGSPPIHLCQPCFDRAIAVALNRLKEAVKGDDS